MVIKKELFKAKTKLKKLKKGSSEYIEAKYEGVTEIRGAGLLLGIQTKMNNEKMSNKLIQKKLLCVPAADNIIRFAPPLIVTKKEIDKALQIIDLTFKENL